MIQKYIRPIAFGFIASFAFACIGSGSALAQQKGPVILAPPQPGSVTGTDPVPPPPPSFQFSIATSL